MKKVFFACFLAVMAVGCKGRDGGYKLTEGSFPEDIPEYSMTAIMGGVVVRFNGAIPNCFSARIPGVKPSSIVLAHVSPGGVYSLPRGACSYTVDFSSVSVNGLTTEFGGLVELEIVF